MEHSNTYNVYNVEAEWELSFDAPNLEMAVDFAKKLIGPRKGVFVVYRYFENGKKGKMVLFNN